MVDFSITDIIEAINDIKPNAASGPDELPTILLKNCKETLAIPLHMMWSNSVKTGVVPDFYKLSHIVPIHKMDSLALPANYRPISLTSHIVKVFERVLRKKLVDYMISNDLICSKQHGFLSGRSCLTQLLHHFDDITDTLTHNKDFDSIYLDYAKAFDKVDHQLLLQKLHTYGVHPKVANWIKSFLLNRTQTVVVNGSKSYPATIISGVPQGTVLGPILFLIFINDIEQCVSQSIIRCFADDTRICKSIECQDDVSALQKDLHNVIEWSERNNMTLHKDKFEYMSHTCNRHSLMSELPFWAENFTYSVSEDITLYPVSKLRDLGVLVSSDLSWSIHIKCIADKARKKAAWVLSVFYTRSKPVMLTLYKSMVRSLLEYCCPLWNPVKITDIQELESVQKVFVSRISGTEDMNYWNTLKYLRRMSLQRRRERYVILHMWKILYSHTSNDLNIDFNWSLRRGYQAMVPPMVKKSSTANQSYRDNSFSILGPRLWNCIPYQFTEINSLPVFKDRLTQFIMSITDTPPIRGYTPINSNSILDWRKDKETSSLWGGYNM